MTVAEQQLLIDTTNLAVLLLAVSFAFRRLMATRNIPLPRGTHGRVTTSGFELPELAVALVIVFFLYATVRYPAIRHLQGSLLVLVLAILAFIGPLRGNDLVSLFGFDRVGGRRLLVWSALSFVSITLLTFLSMWLWQLWIRDLVGPTRPQESIQQLREDPRTMVLPIFLQAAIVAPLSEEILFRGFLYPALKRYTQPFVALVVVAAMFAAIHLHLPALLPLFLLSCLLTASYELSGSLLVPILVHAGFNVVNIAITLSGTTIAHGG